jgi:hypothetical protein
VSNEATAICVFTTYTDWVFPSIVDLILYSAERRRIVFQNEHGLFPISMARNVAVTHFLKSGADNLLMLDNDSDPPIDMLDVLDVPGSTDCDVICWPYVGVSPDNFLQPAWTPLNGIKIAEPLMELLAGGTGSMLIRKRVLEKVREPWFEFKFDRRGVLVQGEDYNFCEKVRAAGFHI